MSHIWFLIYKKIKTKNIINKYIKNQQKKILNKKIEKRQKSKFENVFVLNKK